jgi:hypothetical protein
LTSDKTDDTLWAINPTQPVEGSISYDSFLRFFHVNSKTYLHVIEENNLNLKIVTTDNHYEEDVFNIKKVNEEEQNNIFFLKSVSKPLTDYIEKLKKIDEKNIEEKSIKDIFNENNLDINSVLISLKELIIFTTDSLEMNPELREGK